MTKKVKISGILTINNAIYLGYPFIEAILSVLSITDEFLINDGGSKDKTGFYLRKLKRTFPDKIRLFNKPHYPGDHWEALDDCIEFLIGKARGDWIFQVQGDELWYEKDILKIKKTIENASKKGYNSIRTVRHPANFGSIGSSHVFRNVMIVKKLKGLTSASGGDDFHLVDGPKEPVKGFTSSNVPPELVTDFVYLNLYGTVFPGNAIAKLKAHATFLGRAGELRRQLWEKLKSNPPKKQEPNPKIVKKLPALIQDLAGLDKYKVRDELFDKKFLKKLTGLNY